MIAISPAHLKAIADAAEAAYPEECCGVLVGEGEAGRWRVNRVVASANVTEGDPRRRFEIDPRVLLELHRSLRDGAERVIGVYHSHPDHPARPSATDRERAWEPGLVWLITSVAAGRATQTSAHVVADEGGRFEEIRLGTLDDPDAEAAP